MLEQKEYTKKGRGGHDFLYHDNCDKESCYICNLSCCGTCGAYEGGLTTECPGVKVHYEVQQAVYKEKIDFINGKWIKL